jgi:cell division septum initiation protein DivIVA
VRFHRVNDREEVGRMTREKTGPPPDRFRVRLRGYDRRSVHAELDAIEADIVAAQTRHVEALARVRRSSAELGRGYGTLHEYEWLHAENPTRDPLACFVRHLVFTATCEARSIAEDARAGARTIAEEGERRLAVRREELSDVHREGVRRAEGAAEQASRLVDAVVRDAVGLAAQLVEQRNAFRAWIARTES